MTLEGRFVNRVLHCRRVRVVLLLTQQLDVAHRCNVRYTASVR